MRGTTKPRLKKGFRFLCCTLALICWVSLARAEGMAEYTLKAAFLYNFVAFTKWPAEVGSPLNVCVYGPDPFGQDLDNKIQGQSVNGRSLAVKRITSVDGLGNCQIVFISRPVIGNLPRVLDSLHNKPVLTVADSPGAILEGVVLNMDTNMGKVTFKANLLAAQGNGLSLSSNLLRLATEVIK